MDVTPAIQIVRPDQAATLIGFAISFGLSYVAGLLLRKKPDGPVPDWTPTTLSQRGSVAPRVLGRYRIGPVFAWAGHRIVYSHDSGGGKGGKPGGSKETRYKESAMHVLCVGPATRLLGIYLNGEKITSAAITPDDSPSGTLVNIPHSERMRDLCQFRIYWGDEDQPIDEELKHHAPVASRYPTTCYVVWDPFYLGNTPNWGQLEYDIECKNTSVNELPTSKHWLDDGVTEGLNPAHALYSILTGVYPWGIGMAPGDIDVTSLDAFGSLMETEHLPLNMAVKDGHTASEFVQAIMLDAGFILAQVGDKLVTRPLREPDIGETIPSFELDATLPPLPEMEINHDLRRVDRVVFSFANEAKNFKTYDVKLDDDGQAGLRSSFNQKDVSIVMVTSGDAAAKIAQRRLAEEISTQADVKVSLGRDAALLTPGDVITVTDVGQLRVLTVTLHDDRPGVDISATLDNYARPAGDGAFADGADIQATAAADADVAVKWFELSAGVGTSTSPQIVVFRTRANDQIAGARVWASVDAVSYIQIGNQNSAAAGGLLTTALAATTSDLVATGPIYEAKDALSQDVLDLSSNEAQWQAGRQLLVIGSEIFYLQGVTVQAEADWAASTAAAVGDAVTPLNGVAGLRFVCTVAGTTGATEPDWTVNVGDTVTDGLATWEAHYFTYQLDGLIRARFSTAQAAHAIGDQVYIIARDELSILSAAMILPGVNLCVKTQPFTASASAAISSVTPVCGDIVGLASGETYIVDSGGNYLADPLGGRVVAP